MARPRRKAEEVEATRARILRAAAKLFAVQGFASTSMRQIAQQAGYSAPSLYTYFQCKQGVVDALATHLAGQMGRLFEVALPASASPAQKLELLVVHQLTWAEEQRDAMVFLLGSGAEQRKKSRRQYDDLEYIERLEQWLSQHIPASALGAHSFGEAAYVLWGISTAFFLRWLQGTSSDDIQTRARRVVDLYLYGLAPERHANAETFA